MSYWGHSARECLQREGEEGMEEERERREEESKRERGKEGGGEGKRRGRDEAKKGSLRGAGRESEYETKDCERFMDQQKDLKTLVLESCVCCWE